MTLASEQYQVIRYQQIHLARETARETRYGNGLFTRRCSTTKLAGTCTRCLWGA